MGVAVKIVNLTKPRQIGVSRHYHVVIDGQQPILWSRLVKEDYGANKSRAGKGKSSETAEEREHKYWRNKAYFREDVGLYFPAECVEEGMKAAAKYWGEKIPGEGNKTYTDVVSKGMACEELVILKSDGRPFKTLEDPDIIPYEKFVNGTPTKAKPTKVLKIRPMVAHWRGETVLHVYDARLTPDVIDTILQYMGTYNGMGDYRKRFGHFSINLLEEVEHAIR